MKQGYVLIEENVIRCSQESNPEFPLGAVAQYLLVQCCGCRTQLPQIMRINCITEQVPGLQIRKFCA